MVRKHEYIPGICVHVGTCYGRVQCDSLAPNGWLVSSVGGAIMGSVLVSVVSQLTCGWIRLGEVGARLQSLSMMRWTKGLGHLFVQASCLLWTYASPRLVVPVPFYDGLLPGLLSLMTW